MERFIIERKDSWQRLEVLLKKTEGVNGIRSLPRYEIREMGELYRSAASDLAIAREESRDPKLHNYLNSLVIRAHGKVYRSETNAFGTVGEFFARDFPKTFRETSRYTFVAFAVFFIFAIASFILCFYDHTFAEMLGLDDIQNAAQLNEKWWLSLNEGNQIGSASILTNNIRVSILVFTLGAFFCVGAIVLLATNGLSIGGTLGVCFRVNPAFGNALVEFMVGHGVIELTCVFIAGGAGLLIGYTLIAPGDLSRRDALKVAGLKAAKLVFGVACLLVLAGLIEGFLSPAEIDPAFKFGTGILTGIALFSYLYFAGRNEKNVA